MSRLPEAAWNVAKGEARNMMIGRAKLRGMIPYSELAASIKIFASELMTNAFLALGEISTEEDAAGRGMLSVIVVHKVGDMQPGPGFFELAKQLGRDTSDIVKCWVEELKRVHAFWSVA